MQKYLQAEECHKVQPQLEFPPLAVLMHPGQADLSAAAAMLQPRAGCREHSTRIQESTWLHSDHASRSGTELTILPSVSQKATGGHCLKNTPVLPCCLQIRGHVHGILQLAAPTGLCRALSFARWGFSQGKIVPPEGWCPCEPCVCGRSGTAVKKNCIKTPGAFQSISKCCPISLLGVRL